MCKPLLQNLRNVAILHVKNTVSPTPVAQFFSEL